MRHTAAFLVLLSLIACGVERGVQKSDPVVEARTWSPLPREQRMKVAVSAFEDRSQYGRGQLGTGASRVLTTLLVDSEQFIVYEREQIERVLNEQKFQQTGAVDTTTAVQLGKIVGVDFVIYGAVTKFGMRTEGKDVILYQKKMVAADCTVDVSVINVQTGEIIYAKQGDGTAYKEASRVLGLGGSMGFDQGLAEDSLRAAITQMQDVLIERIRRN